MFDHWDQSVRDVKISRVCPVLDIMIKPFIAIKQGRHVEGSFTKPRPLLLFLGTLVHCVTLPAQAQLSFWQLAALVLLGAACSLAALPQVEPYAYVL